MAHLRSCAAGLTVVALLSGCTGDDGNANPTRTGGASPESTATVAPESQPESRSTPPTVTPTSRPSQDPGPVVPDTAETIASSLDTPWDIAFLPDGSALIPSRDTGDILHITSQGETTVVGAVPAAEPGAEGGLLGMTIAPGATPAEATVFVYVTTSSDNRILRMTYAGGEVGDATVVLDGVGRGESRHQGGRIIFGPDGMLYVSVGDGGEAATAQDLDSLNGKILRMTPDGDVPPDNPFEDSLVYSYGHRNVQGLAFDDDGNLWASEFGQNTWDELNLIEAGSNYGWPAAEGEAIDPAYVDPQLAWPTEEASPSGIAFYRDTIFMCALEGQNLWQIPIFDGQAGEPQPFFTDDYGRLRQVAASPTGDVLWMITNNTDGRADPPFPQDGDDRVLRVTLRQSS